VSHSNQSEQSLYPLCWHDQLGGSADLEAYMRFLTDEAPGFPDEQTAVGGAGEGVPEQFLLDTVNLAPSVRRDESIETPS
jgi:hypothetical protein